MLLYLFDARKNIPVDKINERLTIEGRKRLMTTAEKLRKEGKIEGKKEKTIEIVESMLELKMDNREISKVTKLSVEEIEKIAGKRLK